MAAGETGGRDAGAYRMLEYKVVTDRDEAFSDGFEGPVGCAFPGRLRGGRRDDSGQPGRPVEGAANRAGWLASSLVDPCSAQRCRTRAGLAGEMGYLLVRRLLTPPPHPRVAVVVTLGTDQQFDHRRPFTGGWLDASRPYQRASIQMKVDVEVRVVDVTKTLAEPMRWRIVQLLARRGALRLPPRRGASSRAPATRQPSPQGSARRRGSSSPERFRYWTYYRLLLPSPWLTRGRASDGTR